MTRSCASRRTSPARYPLVQGPGNFGCFAGDTKVELYNGEQKTLAELVDMAHRGARVDVFTVDAHRNVRIKPMRAPRLVRRNDPVVKVTLEAGAEVVCTPDHRFMLRDGTYREAQQLKPKDQLMPFRALLDPRAAPSDRRVPPIQRAWQKVAKVEPGRPRRRVRPDGRHHAELRAGRRGSSSTTRSTTTRPARRATHRGAPRGRQRRDPRGHREEHR